MGRSVNAPARWRSRLPVCLPLTPAIRTRIKTTSFAKMMEPLSVSLARLAKPGITWRRLAPSRCVNAAHFRQPVLRCDLRSFLLSSCRLCPASLSFFHFFAFRDSLNIFYLQLLTTIFLNVFYLGKQFIRKLNFDKKSTLEPCSSLSLGYQS